MCQDALNGPSRLRETRRTSPLAHPTTSRPKPKAWVGRVAHGAPPPYMGPYGPRIYHRTTLTLHRRELRFQGSGLSCRAGARKRRESWEVVRALVKITFPYEPRRWG